MKTHILPADERGGREGGEEIVRMHLDVLRGKGKGRKEGRREG